MGKKKYTHHIRTANGPASKSAATISSFFYASAMLQWNVYCTNCDSDLSLDLDLDNNLPTRNSLEFQSTASKRIQLAS